ncbi:MAG: hypothetical protein ABJ004_02305 [Cyclobacteriaceae bacterium]
MSKPFQSAFFPVFIIVMVYAAVSFLLFNQHGIKVVTDSHRYLAYAEELKDGFYFDPHNFWYLGYVLFIFFIKSFGGGITSLIIAQHIIGLLGALALYFASARIFSNQKTAAITAMAYILFIDIISWNSYVLCESFYMSMLCFSALVLTRIWKGGSSLNNFLLAAPILLLTVVSKPTGIALVAAGGVWMVHRLFGLTKSPLTRAALVLGTLAGMLLLSNKMLASYTHIDKDYRAGELIYSISQLPSTRGFELLIVEPPSDMYLPAQGQPPVLRILSFIIHNPIYWVELFIKKALLLLLHVRPYWSHMHNIYALLFLIPTYVLFARGLKKITLPKDFKLFIGTYLIAHVGIVGLSTVDWDGRFLLPLLPALFLLAAPVLEELISKKVKNVFN